MKIWLRMIVLVILAMACVPSLLFPGHQPFVSGGPCPETTLIPALPYILLVGVLSLMGGRTRLEKTTLLCLLVLACTGIWLETRCYPPGVFATYVVSGLHPRASFAPWVVAGLCVQQVVVATWRRKEYSTLWPFTLVAFLLCYVAIGGVWIASCIHPAFPLSASLPDAFAAFLIGGVFWGIQSVWLLVLYDIPLTVCPFGGWRRAPPREEQQASAPVPDPFPRNDAAGCG